MLKIGIITQARMTSTRLPGKILFSAGGKTILEHHINKLKKSDYPIFVATTDNVVDDPIATLAENLGVTYFRGDEVNVLKRFYGCALENNLDVIVRVTSDCPLIDGLLIKEGLDNYLTLNNPRVYYSNCISRTYPRGLDFEIFSFDLLKEAYFNAYTDSDKEHVTPYINQNKNGNVVVVDHKKDEDSSDLRWTLDTPDDWKLIKLLFEEFNAETLTYCQLIDLIAKNDQLRTINAHIKQKEI